MKHYCLNLKSISVCSRVLLISEDIFKILILFTWEEILREWKKNTLQGKRVSRRDVLLLAILQMLARSLFLPLVELSWFSKSCFLVLPNTTKLFIILPILHTVVQVNLHKPFPFLGHIYKVIYIADNCISVKDSDHGFWSPANWG